MQKSTWTGNKGQTMSFKLIFSRHVRICFLTEEPEVIKHILWGNPHCVQCSCASAHTHALPLAKSSSFEAICKQSTVSSAVQQSSRQTGRADQQAERAETERVKAGRPIATRLQRSFDHDDKQNRATQTRWLSRSVSLISPNDRLLYAQTGLCKPTEKRNVWILAKS